MEQCKVISKRIEKEIEHLSDKNSRRIFIGGLSMGADMALAVYLRTEFQLGGVVSLYGFNPLAIDHIPAVNLARQIPILMINNEYV